MDDSLKRMAYTSSCDSDQRKLAQQAPLRGAPSVASDNSMTALTTIMLTVITRVGR